MAIEAGGLKPFDRKSFARLKERLQVPELS
jgi:hypothetical protein